MRKKIAGKKARVETQSMDPVFGQSRAFALNGTLVNPDAVAYLNGVRKEALRTSAIDVTRSVDVKKTRAQSHNTDFYDEEPILNRELIKFNRKSNELLQWFLGLREYLVERGLEDSREQQGNAQEFSGYDIETLNLLVHYFKNYLRGRDNKDDTVAELLLEILKDFPSIEEDQSLAIDEAWAEKLLDQLRSKTVNNVEELKEAINKPAKASVEFPKNAKGWHSHINKNEPSSKVFTRLTLDQKLKLIGYMTQWLNHTVGDKSDARQISQWCLYTLLSIPEHLPAPHISILRELGKKAKQLKLRSCQENIALLPLTVSSEMIGNYTTDSTVPQESSITDLVLVVVSKIYGQRDLVEW